MLPTLIALRIDEIEADRLPVRVVGLSVGLAAAGLLIWSAVVLGRFLMHEAAVREEYDLRRIGDGESFLSMLQSKYEALRLDLA